MKSLANGCTTPLDITVAVATDTLGESKLFTTLMGKSPFTCVTEPPPVVSLPLAAAVTRPLESTVILALRYVPGVTAVLASVNAPVLASVASPLNAISVATLLPLPTNKWALVNVVESLAFNCVCILDVASL